MKGHGITVTGKTVEEATMRVLNFNALARATLQVAQTDRRAPDTWVWRYYVRKLREEDLRFSVRGSRN